jgi:hypothetical protein
MPNILPDSSLIKNINNDACNVCQEGSSYNVCMVPPEALVNTDLKCNTKCSDQYNAKSYFYDKDGTKRCYCGKTKVSCEQVASISKPCDGNGSDICVLRPGAYIGGVTVPETVNTNDVCKIECKKILQSDGLYCSDSNKCICTNPVQVTKLIPSLPLPQCIPSDSTLKCPDGKTPIQSNSDKILPDTYMKYGDFLGPSGSNDSIEVRNAFCDCDNDIAVAYNNYFPNSKPTLGSIWAKAVKETAKSSNIDELYKHFNAGVNDVTGGDIDKIKVLSAYEMCRVTNDKYKRTKEAVSPNPSTDFEGWLKYHLGESDSGKLLNTGVKILVMAMLLHILFRTLVPIQGNMRESLIYAMFMPQEFLQNNVNAKVLVLGSSIVFMLLTMSVAYFGSIDLTLYVLYSITGLIIGGAILSFFRYRWLRYGLLILPIVAILILLLSSSKETGFIEYFIPQSLSSIPKSGFAISIYAVIIGAIITKVAFGPRGMALLILFVAAISAIALLIFGVIIKDEKSIWENNYTSVYFIILGCLLVIYVISYFATMYGAGNVSRYFIPYVLSTLFGVLPLATFAIILNFAIANYSPAIEILFLVLYRLSGFLVANNPASTLGKVLLKISGKRSTDKWVLPFLPWVTYIIDAYYLVSRDNKPAYYTPTGVATGVRNSDMWLS